MNNYIKLDIISHLSNRKIFQIIGISKFEYIAKKRYDEIYNYGLYFSGLEDIKFPIAHILHIKTETQISYLLGNDYECNYDINNKDFLLKYFFCKNNHQPLYDTSDTLDYIMPDINCWCINHQTIYRSFYIMKYICNNGNINAVAFNKLKNDILQTNNIRKKIDIINNFEYSIYFKKCEIEFQMKISE